MLAKALSAATAAAGTGNLYIEDVMASWLYTGNGSTRTITNGIDLSGEGGLVWIKCRNLGNPHALFDTQRGATYMLQSQSTAAQALWSDSLTSFGSSGFSLGADTNAQNVNVNNDTYASWTFRKAAKFFDVVTYTGNGANRTVAHNLGSVPGCIIVKRTDTTGDWQVYHRANTAAPETDYLVLNSTAATADSNTRWNDTLPTSTVFSLGTDTTVNASGGTYVAYLFAHDAGGFGDAGDQSVVSCGSYTGNGSTSGPTVTLGWEPQWVLVKSTGSATFTGWFMFDNMRGMVVGNGDPYLYAQSSGVEAGATEDYINPTATGFTLNNPSQVINESGVTYIYIAIRRGPMKTPTDATKVFSANAFTSSSNGTTTTGFPPDLVLYANRDRTAFSNSRMADRLRGAITSGPGQTLDLMTESTSAEGAAISNIVSTDNVSFKWQSGNTGYSIVSESFRRAPGFFDVVAYTGGGFVNESISHNLGVKPELVIIKRRNTSELWWVNAVFGASTFQQGSLNTTDQFTATTYSAQGFGNPTSSALVFNSIGSGGHASGGTYIAYLFATCPGVSKVGSYTGTGTTQQINCGFTSGARFVLIKRTDSTGDWYVWDTARGIISGNDPYLLINSTAAEVTNTDYIDPLNSGFEISSTAPAAINANGGSFIFLAIA